MLTQQYKQLEEDQLQIVPYLYIPNYEEREETSQYPPTNILQRTEPKEYSRSTRISTWFIID